MTGALAATNIALTAVPPVGPGEAPAGVLPNAVAPAVTNRLAFRFCGYDWIIKDTGGNPVGPGPNVFSSNASNVWVDAQGRLHLRITETNGHWHCAEVISQRRFGYGTYRFYLDTPAESLDVNAVLGLFTWSNAPEFAHRELDVELARWSDATDSNNAQFVVQPWDTAGHRQRYRIPPGLTNTTHSFTWATNQVLFQSHQGALLGATATNPVIHQWTYNRPGVPVPGDENVRLNLWLFRGAPPTNRQPVEVIIRRFVFVPPPLPAATSK
jgi:hypothetical protein